MLAFGFVTYVAVGARLGARRHPHARAWREIWGLAIDGCRFVQGGGGKAADLEGMRASLLPASGTEAAASKRATRGVATALHQAVAAASVSEVQRLLLASPCAASLNAGDKRRSFTAFHNACAGGHVEIVQLLLAAGCDTRLANDGGYNGWELATQLRRTDVVALRTGRGGGKKRSGKWKKEQHGGNSQVAAGAISSASAGAPRRLLL
eukprot:SAG11_NODE_2789_length_2971_cov_1.344359_1_plen_208_part_00